MTRSEWRAAQIQKALADLLHLLREIGAELITLLIVALPLLVRGVCVSVAVGGAAWAFIPLWLAFGGDGIALLPCGALLLAPIAFVLAGGLSWGGLLMGGAVDGALGLIAPTLSPVALNLFCVGIIGAAVFNELNTNNNSERTNRDEQQTTQ